MRQILLLFALLVLPLLGIAQSNSELPKDEAFKVGRLENGLTYYIRHNEFPANQACFYIAQKVGSMQEEESQRGLAHLLEHMCFNGTEHFPNDRMIKYLEENGIKFGAELNAYTSFDETVYNIDNVPTNKGEALIDSCLQILADWSGGVSLLDDEIDKERGVVKSEYLLRQSPIMRQYEQLLPIILKGSKYAERMPIGLMSVVEGCTYDELRAYYKKWYHPSLQGIIVVGDIDPEKIEAKIKEMFSKYRNPENEAPRVENYCPMNDQPIYAAAKDKEQAYTQILLNFKCEQFPLDKHNTKEYLNHEMKSDLVSTMISNRFDEIDSKSDSPNLQAGGEMGEFTFVRTMGAFTLYAIPKPGQENDAYKSILREALRLKKFGFTQSELDRAKADLITVYENNYTNRDKQQNDVYVQMCVNSFLNGDNLMGWKDKLDNAKSTMGQITLDAVNKTVESIITEDGKNMVAFSFGPDKEGANLMSEDIYKELTKEVMAETITPYQDEVITDPLLKKLPKAGKILSETIDQLFGAKVLVLSNGAKAVIKKTDFKEDEIIFKAVSMGGTSLYSDQDYYNFQYLDQIVGSIGMGNFSSTQLSKLTQGKSLSLSPSLSNQTEEMSGSCVPKDLDFFMQTIYCAFTQPGHNEDDFKNFQQMLKQYIENRSQKHTAALSDTINNNLYKFNIRAKSFSTEDVDKIDLNRVINIYKERYADADQFTFFFVGNFDEKELKSEICKYIASLPSKKNANETYAKGKMDVNKKDINIEFARKMETPESQVQIIYINNGFQYNLENKLKTQVLAEVIKDKLFHKIREESSIAYTTNCGARFRKSEEEGKAQLMFILTNPIKPEYAEVALGMMNDIVKDVCDNGFEQEKLDKVKSYLIKHNEEVQKDNSYWMGNMEESYMYGNDMMSEYADIVNSLTVKDLQDLLKQIVNTSAKETYIMIPEGVEQKATLD